MSRAAKTVVHKPPLNVIDGISRRQRAETVIRQNVLAQDFEMDQLSCSWPQKSVFVISELLSTEKSYIESLEEVVQGYLKPLYEYLLSASQGSKFIQTVFCNLPKLLKIHMELYISLVSSYQDPSKFGNVFTMNVENFREYIHYCTNFPKCEELLQQVMKSEQDTRDFIIQCQMDIGHPLPLITYLHKPVQRILKYRLLLEQALKGMSDNLEGFAEMKNALKMMSNVAMEMNEVKRKFENMQRVESIQKSLISSKSPGLRDGDLKSYGSLVFEEKCKVFGRFGGERIMMLFETRLLFLRPKGSQRYIYKGHILVEELDVCGVSNSNVLKVFSVYKPSQKIAIEVKTAALKDKIMNQIQSVLVKDLKEQEHIRLSQKNKKENEQKQPNLAHDKSLLASELQSRRRTRQISTRKSPNGSDANKTSNLSPNKIKKIASKDSGIEMSSAQSNSTIEEEPSEKNMISDSEKKLRRRTAVRRKETSRGHLLKRASLVQSLDSCEPPATVSYSYPLESGMWNLDDPTQQDIDIESSLDKGTRTPEFLRQHSLQTSPSGEEEVFMRPRSDIQSSLPDPSLLLRDMPGCIGEEGNGIWNWTTHGAQSSQRVSVSSREDNFPEASLCSNLSSLSAEDHYYLSTMENSSIIAGMDGDNITIYDNDSDEEEWEEEEEGEKGQEAVTRQQVFEGDIMEKSLRSCLSKAKLWNSSDEDKCSISPLATLPRMFSKGEVCRLQYAKSKSQLMHSRSSVDVLQSLSPSSLSPELHNKAETIDIYGELDDSSTTTTTKTSEADDLLESFVLSLPQSPDDIINNRYNRDSWVPPDEPTFDNTTGWTLERYLSEEPTNTPVTDESEANNAHTSLTEAASIEGEPVEDDHNRQFRGSLLDSGFQSVEMNIDHMIAMASELHWSRESSNGHSSNNKSFRGIANFQKLPVKENIYVETIQTIDEQSPIESNQHTSSHVPIATKTVEEPQSTQRDYPSNPLPDNSLIQRHYEPLDVDTFAQDCIYLKDKSLSSLQSSVMKQRSVNTPHTSQQEREGESSTKTSKVCHVKIDNSLKRSIQDRWTELQSAVMAKISLTVVSLFAPWTLQQTLLVCMVVCVVLCLLYFIKCYWSSSYGKDK